MLFGGGHFMARIMLSGALFFYLLTLFDSIFCRSERIFSLVTSLFFCSVLIIPALFHCASEHFPFYSRDYPDPLVNKAAFVFLIFSASFFSAHWITKRNLAQPDYPRFTLSGPKTLILISVLSILATVIFASHPAQFMTRRGELSDLLSNPSPLSVLISYLGRTSGYLCFIINVCAVAQKGKGKIFAALLPVTLTLAILLNNPINIPRFPLLALFICSTFVLTKSWTINFKALFSGFYAIGLFTIFPILSTISRGKRGAGFVSDLKQYYTNSGDFDGFQSIINVVDWIDREGIQWGKQIISALFVFIPRDFWPDKAEGTGGLAARYAGYSFINISAPLPAEFYSDFGIFGALFGGVAVGLIVSRMNTFAANGQGKLGVLLCCGLAAGYTGILLRGSLIGVIGPSALAILMGLSANYANAKTPSRPQFSSRR